MKRIKRASVKDQVFAQLRDQILAKTWPPGSKIPSENALAVSLGVSRVSIRESLQMLVSLGFLETRQGEGTFVRQYTGEVFLSPLFPMIALDVIDILDVLEYRLVVEKGTVALVVEKAGEAEIEEIERVYRDMCALTEDTHAFAQADLEFHLALAKATGNPVIVKVNDVIKSVLSVSMEGVVKALGVRDGVVFHGKIIEAIKARDRARAETLMEEHVRRTIERLRTKTGRKQ
jgi:GntR family transcriptional repressor for pyruvate dehydrogenase complex